MIIGVCGFGSTGSSAVSDLLKEYSSETQALDDEEFILPYTPDGLLALKECLFNFPNRGINSGVAIERFHKMIFNYYCETGIVKNKLLTKKQLLDCTDVFLKQIIQLEWNGYDGTEPIFCNKFKKKFFISFLMQRVIPKYEKKHQKDLHIKPYREIPFSIFPNQFDVSAKNYLKTIIKDMGGDSSKKIILDQPFPGDDPASCFSFFDDPKAIVVDRDPRDNYLFAKLFLRCRGRFIPTDMVDKFIFYYRQIRQKKAEYKKDNRILSIQFEDLVYNYEQTKTLIEQFCDLTGPQAEKKLFVPSMSKANTQLILRYPQYSEDIRKIEKELPEFLFPFEKYGAPDSNRQMFFGRSPLNKHAK